MKFVRIAFLSAVCLYLPAAITPAAVAQINHGAKASKVTGTITSRDGNTINVFDNKDGSTKIVNLSDTIRIQRDGFLSQKK